MAAIEVKNLKFKIGDKEISRGIDLVVKEGSTHGIIGPNGSGKSTLFKQICRIHKPYEGTIELLGQDVNELTQKQMAKKMAVLFQENKTDFAYTVREIVSMGRIPYHSSIRHEYPQDKEIVDRALETMGIREYEDRIFNTLSGGEKQRVLLARAFAQETSVILLDEPTNNLDISYQLLIFEILKKLDKTKLIVIHDMNLAASFCDVISVLEKGRVVATGSPGEILTQQLLADIFKVKAEVIIDKDTNKPLIRYIEHI